MLYNALHLSLLIWTQCPLLFYCWNFYRLIIHVVSTRRFKVSKSIISNRSIVSVWWSGSHCFSCHLFDTFFIVTIFKPFLDQFRSIWAAKQYILVLERCLLLILDCFFSWWQFRYVVSKAYIAIQRYWFIKFYDRFILLAYFTIFTGSKNLPVINSEIVFFWLRTPMKLVLTALFRFILN